MRQDAILSDRIISFCFEIARASFQVDYNYLYIHIYIYILQLAPMITTDDPKAFNTTQTVHGTCRNTLLV